MSDVLDQLERILLLYEKTKEMELKRAEISAKIASDILEQNRKSQMEMMKFFNQFINPTNPKNDE